ncbi:MAG TPA: hypothetical protein VNC50_16635, partial [Planctomycetia bacterium]|nr:hypothetical protein [Planctomycetia bacterium]
MSSKTTVSRRFSFAWPLAGIGLAIGLFCAFRPSQSPRLSPDAALAIWGSELLVLAALGSAPWGARAGVLASGALLPLAAYVAASPLARLLLACFMAMAFVRAVESERWPLAGGFGVRLAALCSLFDLRQAKLRPRRFDGARAWTLLAAVGVFAAALAVIAAVPAASGATQ